MICYTSGTTANPKGVLLSQVIINIMTMTMMIMNNPQKLTIVIIIEFPMIMIVDQDNLTWTAASATATYELLEGEEVMISYLPVSHIVAQVIIVVNFMIIVITKF